MKNRGFEKLFEDAIIPTRATAKSAGYDFYAYQDIEIKPGEIVLVPTGVCSYMMDDEYLAIFIRSSMAIKNKMQLANNVAVIDADYYHNASNMGHIFCAMKNTGEANYKISKGDRIAQGIFMKYLTVDDEKTPQSKRSGGLGSTNK